MTKELDKKITFKNTLFITGLKALAALGVFFTHFGFFYDPKSEYFNQLMQFGQNGVVLFFLISSFTISLSISHLQKFNFLHYIKKRYLRIAPMLYLVTIYGFLTAMSPWRYPEYPRYDFLNLFAHFTFLNLGEINFQFQNSLIGVEWVIPIEFLFYLIIPILLFKFRNKFVLFLILMLSLFLHLSPEIYDLYKSDTNIVGFHWSIQKYFFVSVLGIVTYYLFTESNPLGQITKISKRLLLSASCILLFHFLIITKVTMQERVYFNLLLMLIIYVLYLKPVIISSTIPEVLKGVANNAVYFVLGVVILLYLPFKFPNSALLISISTSILILATKTPTLFSKLILQNKFLLHLGVVSYSFYLLQYPIHIFFFKNLQLGSNLLFYWFLLFTTTLALSTLTHALIEKKLTNLISAKLTYQNFSSQLRKITSKY